jgi:hypothetical protein
MREVYLLFADRPRRVSVTLAPLDGGDPLRLSAQLYDASGALVPRVSAEVGPPLLRDEWDLPETGEYVIQVFGPETEPRAFALTALSRPVAETGGSVIAYGESLSGEIAVRGQRDRWVFAGRARDRVRISLAAPTADAILEVYDPAGRLLAQNDDSQDFSRNPALELTLPADGNYTIVARMYGDDATGTYRLTLERLADSDE